MLYRTIATTVYVLLLIFHLMFIHVVMALVLPPGTSVWWAPPFALTYALFIGITMGICYHHVLPKESRKYWQD